MVNLIKKYNPKAKLLLELTCGTGNFTKHLTKAGFIDKATDISWDVIEKAKTKSIDAKFYVEDMSKLDIAE